MANVVDADRRDARQHGVERQRRAIDEGLARELLGARRGRFERGQGRDLELRLGAVDFRFVEPQGGLGEAVERGARDLAGVLGGRAGVEAEQAAVGKSPVERIDRIGEAALLAHFLEQARRHAAAGRRGEDMGGVVVGGGDRAALESDDDVRLLEPLLHHRLAAAIGGRRRRFGLVGAERRQQRFGARDDPVVVDRARRGDDRRAGAIVAAQIGGDRRAVEAADAFAGAEDRPADRLARPGGGGEEIEDEIVGRVLDRADLLQNDVLLAREFFRIEPAVGEDVGDDVERKVDVLAEHAGEIGGLLDAGLGVEIAADVLDRLGDRPRVALGRALERHVLEQMRQPVFAFAFVARAGGDEHAERGGAQIAARVGDDAQARRQGRQPHAHAATLARSRTNFATAAGSLGRIAQRSRRDCDLGEMGRQFGTAADGAFDRLGEFGRMGGRQRDHRRCRIARERRARRVDADRAVRIDDDSAVAIDARHLVGAGLFVDALGVEVAADRGQRRRRDRELARLLQRPHQRANRARVAAVGVEQQPLEIGRDLDVHRRRLGRLDAERLVEAGGERAGEDVVLVGGDRQSADRQAHALGVIAGEHVAEIAGRHGEGDAPVRRAERDRAGEVIDDLGEDARPVDRVDARQAELVAEGEIAEQRLDDRLAVVERALDRRSHGRSPGRPSSSACAARRRRGRAGRG